METQQFTQSIFSELQSLTTGKISDALAKAQGEMKQPEKNRTVKIRTKAGFEYTFSYADLSAILEAIKLPFSKYALAYRQHLGADQYGHFVLTVISHSSGEWIASRYPLPNPSDPKEFGGSITYGKRYSMSALVGVVADDDNDAEAQNLVQQPEQRKAPVQQAAVQVRSQPTQQTIQPSQNNRAQAQTMIPSVGGRPVPNGTIQPEPEMDYNFNDMPSESPFWNPPADATPSPGKRNGINTMNGQQLNNGRRSV